MHSLVPRHQANKSPHALFITAIVIIGIWAAAKGRGRTLLESSTLQMGQDRRAVAASAKGLGVHSYELQATEEIWLRRAYPDVPTGTGPVRIEIQQWYRSPTEWRTQERYLTPPLPALRAAFLASPTLVVRNGRIEWTYDSLHKTWTRQRLRARHSQALSPAALEDRLWRGVGYHSTVRVTSLTQLLRRVSACDTPVPFVRPKPAGNGVVAGHAAYVIDFGTKPCGWNSDSAPEMMGRQVLWADRRTFFILRDVHDTPWHGGQLFMRTSVVRLAYNRRPEAGLFVFRPPPGSHEVPLHAAPPAPARPMSLPLIRRRVPFPVFAPAWLPLGLRSDEPELDGEQHVTIDFGGRGRTLHVLEGPVGCCLDVDPRKYGSAVKLASGQTAYGAYADSHFGGLIIWWDRGHTYISLQSFGLSEHQLLKVAVSMSKTAPLAPQTVSGIGVSPLSSRGLVWISQRDREVSC